MPNPSPPPRPFLTADAVVIRFRGRLEVLLVERANPPFQGHWALPGGFVDEQEPPEVAAARELAEEAGIEGIELLCVGVFGAPGRDPRGWTVSAGYLGLAPPDVRAVAGSDAAEARWFPLDDLPALAFDHRDIIAAARERLRELAQLDTRPLRLLPVPFRTRQARWLYSAILGEPISPSAFKAWLRRRGAVERTGPARFRPAARLTRDWVR